MTQNPATSTNHPVLEAVQAAELLVLEGVRLVEAAERRV